MAIKTKSKVNAAGNYTKPSLRKNIFNRVKAGGKGGAPGQWSARKAQMLAVAIKKQEEDIAMDKKERCDTCTCYECDCEECTCECHEETLAEKGND